MNHIEYKITYGDGEHELVVVYTKGVNAGFSKALKRAREPLGSGRVREIARIEFWQVTD
jgi:hypothetical protein